MDKQFVKRNHGFSNQQNRHASQRLLKMPKNMKKHSIILATGKWKVIQEISLEWLTRRMEHKDVE